MCGPRWWMLVALAGVAAAGPVSSAPAAFPGENGKILFVRSNQDYVGHRIHVADADGTGAVPIGEGNLRATTDPQWSPDGRRIVYKLADGFAVKRADGTHVTTVRPDWYSVDHPSWSPDGKQLVYSYAHPTHCELSYCTYDYGIRRINLDGTGDTLLLPYGGGAAWSPDGAKIAFIGPGYEGRGDVYVMNSDGSGATNVGNDPAFDFNLTWSPDGQRIAFERLSGDNIDVVVMNADGTDQRRITADRANEGNVAWSPDGRWILFVRAGVIFRTDPSGTFATQVSADDHDGHPDWQPLVNRVPDCSSVVADPASLWPANKRFRTVTLSGATDADGDVVTLRVIGVTHDEGGVPGWRHGSSPDQVQLRAKRDPRGDGRVYTITFEATDEHGASCNSAVTVTVPRHKK